MILDRIALLLITALCVVIPVAHTTGLRNTLAGLLALLILPLIIKEKRLPLPGAVLPLWALICLASTIWSVTPAWSLGDALTSALVPVLCAFAAANWITKESASRMGTALLAAVMALLLLRFSTLLSDSPAALGKIYERYWPGRNAMSTLTIMALPLASWLIATGRRTLGTGLLAVCLIAGAQDWNRMFWVTALLMLILCALMFRLSRQKLLGVILIGSLLIASGAYYAAAVRHSADRTAPEEVVREMVQKDLRWEIWRNWRALGMETPVLGHGYGPRATHSVGQQRLPELDKLGIFHSHNLFIGIFFQLGTLGLLVFGALLADLLRRFVQRASDPDTRPAAVGGIALIVGAVSKNMTDDLMYYEIALIFWLMLGVFAGLARLGKPLAPRAVVETAPDR